MFAKVSSWPRADHFARPERKEGRRTFLDRLAWEIAGYGVRPWSSRPGRLKKIVDHVERAAVDLDRLSDDDLRRRSESLRHRLRVEGFSLSLAGASFALVREAAWRVLGMRHFDCQLMGGYAMLRGLLAEMETGEGKTLVATLPAVTVALAGIPVHIITVNDYLTDRDARLMGDVYRFFDLSVGCVIHEKTPVQRREAYGCDITYCTNKEVVFDYLRDRIVLGDTFGELKLHAERLSRRNGRSDQLMLRGLHYAIVDEADSVLVDEARTPLIISRSESSKDEERSMKQALELTKDLVENVHYTLRYEADQGLRAVMVTDRGREEVQRITADMGTVWQSPVRREELVRKALTALFLYRRDEHYLVSDGTVQIIDEFTGRVMPDRSWEGGLHQLIEIKEGCEVTGQRETVARISYQRFFRRYLKLSGMTGTAREVRRELWSIYGLPVVAIPTNRPLRRKILRDEIFRGLDEKYEHVTRRVEELHRRNLPVLIGTRTVAASEHLSLMLDDRGIPHQVLNAKQDREEALIVAGAGKPGRVTIATNMAGRGTDIKLASGVAERGGLQVLMTERHEAGRIDRQLAGRCGRQGDPGMCEVFVSLEDPLLRDGYRGITGRMVAGLSRGGSDLWKPLGRHALKKAQRRVERVHAGVRKRLLRYDEERSDTLSFSGRSE
ncbi:MAG: preprotein translocase subunit SecA [Syntrophales bacterium]|nr:preprotein translocase subunit SecA [Syntrophales bacterium]MCK9528446.1 preprotein translocase subunit SecA [Syntrophales bacterium]MDX9922469.1 preprotein translocase subunit SecA [Syntrophales bacterium]